MERSFHLMIYIGLIIIASYVFGVIWLGNGIIQYSLINDDTFHPEVSIIISAHNEEKNIANLLDILINQEYQSDYEIIIANDRSTDLTESIISSYVNQYSNIRLININMKSKVILKVFLSVMIGLMVGLYISENSFNSIRILSL